MASTPPSSRIPAGAAADPALARKGGSVTARQSRAKKHALKALHAARRGRRINAPGLSRDDLTILLQTLHHLLTSRHRRGLISLRAAGAACRVHPRTISRWLRGIDHPHARYIPRLQRWIAKVCAA